MIYGKLNSYHTGEVFDQFDNRSGQIDIVLHPITSPKLNLYNSINIFPAETVLAAIEIKSNLTTGDESGALNEALASCKKIKGLEIPNRPSKGAVVDPQRVPFIVFAFKGPTLETVKKHLNIEPLIRDLPDLIVVLDRGYYLVKNNSWKFHCDQNEDAYMVKEDSDTVLLGIYEYILNIIEFWAANPSIHTMPIREYTKDMPSLWDLFS